MTQPLVSIIIPTYNRAHIIGETLDSVLAQTYQNWECLVVDDGSSDSTIEIMKNYCNKDNRIKYHHRSPDHLPGGNGARNYGYELSKGDYIQWFDSDDLMHREKLYLKVLLMQNTNAECVISKALGFKTSIEDVVFITPIKTQDVFKDFILKAISIGTSQPMWDRRFLGKINLFDEAILRSQDLEFHSRVFYSGVKFELLDRVLTYYRVYTEKGITSSFYLEDNDKYILSNLEVYKRIHLMVLKKNNDDLYYGSVNIFLRFVKDLVRNKKYKQARHYVYFLMQNSIKKKFGLYFQFKGLLLIIFILKLLNGKGYEYLKHYFRLNRT